MFRKIEISHKTIIFTVALLLGLGFIYIIRDIILELFVALLLMTILEPMVLFFVKIKIPRPISVLLTYLLVVGILGGLVAIITPIVVEQTTSFINSLSSYLTKLGVTQSFSDQIMKNFLNTLGNIPGQIFELTFSVFSNFIRFMTVLVFAFYMLLSRNKLDDQMAAFFGDEKKKNFARTLNILENRLGGWARGQLLLMFTIGLGTYIGLLLIGIPFALPLSILAGIFEIIPFLGPIISAVPAIIIGFGISPLTGLATAGVSFLVHQLENYILVPKIMEKSVGVSPIITLAALAVGAKLAGIVGIIISVPVVITLQVLIKEFLVKD